MTTVINTPSGNNSDGSGLGVIVGVLIVVVAIILFFVYGMPAIRENKQAPDTTTINVEMPTPTLPVIETTPTP